MQRRLLIASVLLLSFAFVATGFLAANGLVQSTSNNSNELFLIPDHVAGVVNNGHSLGPAKAGTQLSVVLSLPYSNQAQLNYFLAAVQDPSSPLYHHYLTQSQFVQDFSPSAMEYYHYVQYFMSQGFHVKTYGDMVSLVLSGTVAQYQATFHMSMSNFVTVHGTRYIAPSSQLMLPVFYGPISSIVGLNTRYTAHISPLFQGSGSSQTLYGADFQNAYQLSKLYQKYGFPTNETIATILWSGTSSSGSAVAPYVPSDITYYFQHNLPSSDPQPIVYGYPIAGAPAPGPSAANDNSQADYESTLDLEMAGSTAPGAHVVEVYGPSATQACLDQAFAAVLNPSYNTSVNSALSHVVAISNSWGGTDANDSTWMQYEQEAAARGITVLASSGDNGNSGGNVAPSFPATMSYGTFGTLAVGGACTVLSGTASTDGSGTTGISSQSVWYNTPSAGDGSQGGVSSVFAEPSWQAGSSDANSVITGASSTTGVSSGRGTPDVAADGANMEIYITYSGSSSYQELWGTSVASPLTAGIVAVMDHSLGTPEGFMNPLVYKFGQEQVSGTFSGAPALYFISNGSNAVFSANNGYSLAVGWGSINAYNFVQAQLGTATPPPTDYAVTFTESGLASGTSWSVTFNGNTQSSTGTSTSFSVPNGTYSYTIGSVTGYSVSPSSGSVTVNGAAQSIALKYTVQDYAVTFTESGLASGTSWSVTFNGNTQSSTGTSTSFSVPDGSYSYTVGTVSGYTASPSSGTVSVNGAAQSVAIKYSSATSSPAGVFSQVNATSANTYTYNLPEAEEFTVGSSSHAINFVSLYLSGSGTVQFAIGTSLWGTNTVPLTTVNVNSGQVWYNTSIPSVTLTGGTDYYLTVEGSGSIQLGYTTSPSVNLNALQDYWYSSPPSNGLPSGTPTSDNSYPNMYSVGYSSSAAVIASGVSLNLMSLMEVHVFQPVSIHATYVASGSPANQRLF